MFLDFFNKTNKLEENIETIENKIKAFETQLDESDAHDELAMGCDCEPCDTPDCRSTITFEFQTCIKDPAPMVGANVPIEVSNENLRCVIDKCSVDVEVPDPCTQSGKIPCNVCLNRYSYIGCIEFLANIPRRNKTVTACFSGCELIDSVRCFSCPDVCFPCPPQTGFISGTPTAKVKEVCTSCTGISIVKVEVSVTLTKPCPTPSTAKL